MRAVIFPLIVLSLAACKAPAPAEPVAEKPAQAAPAPAASAPPTEALPAEAAPPPATGTLHVDLPAAGAISLAGFGPAKFGATAEEVRMAWGGDLGDAKPSEPGGCYYLIPATQPKRGYKIAFMVEGDKFVRIDVASNEIVAPGGGKIGMGEAELQKLYHGALQSMPHKYVEGARYLSVAASGVAPSKLVFATDASGKATEWRIGLPPQVDYVEGCS